MTVTHLEVFKNDFRQIRYSTNVRFNAVRFLCMFCTVAQRRTKKSQNLQLWLKNKIVFFINNQLCMTALLSVCPYGDWLKSSGGSQLYKNKTSK